MQNLTLPYDNGNDFIILSLPVILRRGSIKDYNELSFLFAFGGKNLSSEFWTREEESGLFRFMIAASQYMVSYTMC